MKLIHFQGLNCYHGCMITLADTFGLNYIEAFSGLWAEGRLRYDPICQVYLSQKIEKTLETAGMKLGTPLTAQKELVSGWKDTPPGNYAILGMDACFIPWSPLYQLIHGPHYFIVQKGISDSHDCFDPTYGLYRQKLTTQELILNAYALITVKTVNAAMPFINNNSDPLLAQAQEVLRSHPETLRYFIEQAGIWIQKSEKTALLPAKYIDALLTGRYLYKAFLKQLNNAITRAPLFFSQQYYEEWLTVKNGFYKAALTTQNNTIFQDACHLFTRLIEQELELARQISSAGSEA